MRPVLLVECLTEILGGQRVALQIAAALQNRVVLTCPGEGSLACAARDLGIEVVFAPALAQGSPRTLFRSARQLHSLLQQTQPSLIYVNGLTGLPAMHLANRKLGLPLVFHVHHLVKSPLHRAVVRWIGKHNQHGRSITCSAAVANYCGLSPATNHIIYNGIDENLYCFQPQQTAEMRESLGSFATRFLVAFIGDIGGIKAHQLVFDGALQAVEEQPNLQILCAGKILPTGESLVSHAQERAAQAGVPDLFLFPGWRNDLEKIYPLCDLTILGHDEGFPLSGLESAACGTPLALPALGGADELGKLLAIEPRYSATDPRSLARFLVNVASSPDRPSRERLAQDVGKRFSISSFQRQVIDLVDSLVLE